MLLCFLQEVAENPPDGTHDVELWDKEGDGCEQPLVSRHLESPQLANYKTCKKNMAIY